MSTGSTPSRRDVLALAAALAATVVTAIAAVGGLQNWHRRAYVPQPAITQPAQLVTTPPSGEEND